jgi:hypothetical protein
VKEVEKEKEKEVEKEDEKKGLEGGGEEAAEANVDDDSGDLGGVEVRLEDDGSDGGVVSMEEDVGTKAEELEAAEDLEAGVGGENEMDVSSLKVETENAPERSAQEPSGDAGGMDTVSDDGIQTTQPVPSDPKVILRRSFSFISLSPQV